MAFVYKRNLNGGHNRTLIKVLLGNSKDFRVGDPVAITTGGAVIDCSAGVRVLGHIAGLIQDNGTVPANNGCAGAFVQTYRTASDNTTVAKVAALVDIDPNSLYSAAVDDTIGTTTGSNTAFYMMDLDTGLVNRGVDESSAGQTNGQYFSFGLDPDNSNRVLVKPREVIVQGDSGF